MTSVHNISGQHAAFAKTPPSTSYASMLIIKNGCSQRTVLVAHDSALPMPKKATQEVPKKCLGAFNIPEMPTARQLL